MIIESNRALLQHFSKMAVASQDEAHINLDFVESLLKNGADINAADRYGQTVLHEVFISIVIIHRLFHIMFSLSPYIVIATA